ncbi:uncharacterized protein LOC144097615 [Amblyomma americanum]
MPISLLSTTLSVAFCCPVCRAVNHSASSLPGTTPNSSASCTIFQVPQRVGQTYSPRMQGLSLYRAPHGPGTFRTFEEYADFRSTVLRTALVPFQTLRMRRLSLYCTPHDTWTCSDAPRIYVHVQSTVQDPGA